MSTSIDRTVHLVGTIPADDTHDALQLVVDTVGDRVGDQLPDGETGDRYNWIGRLIESLKTHPDLELTRDGDWSDYESTPAFKVKSGHTFESVGLDYYEAFGESWPEFQKARIELGRPDLRFQVGIPGPIDLAFASFGFNPISGFRYSGPFENATVAEIERIHAVAGDEVVYQIEIPIELEVAIRIPSPLRPAGTRWLARRILRVVERAPEGTRWGIHLCVGDMNNTAFSKLGDSRPSVLLSNALVDQFPTGRTLEFVHMPFAHGSIPPTTEEAFYAPLSDLNVPDDVRFIAGFVHESQDVEDQRSIQRLVEERIGHPVDVSAACGLGRRPRAQAVANLELSRRLVDDD